jgi:1-aminocyclopropane-1-carboxylate deaminase/D-cysteine desulfhydrase-like pyridoxal-dependent ACC family enzyme
VLSGPPADPPGPGVGLMRALGAVLHQLPDADRAGREAEVERVAASVRARGGRPYVIRVGGSGAIGAWGQVLAGIELFEQAAAAGLAIDRILVPSATGGTQAGLIAAARGRSTATGVTGVIVARPASELRPAIESTVVELMAMSGSEPAARPETPSLSDSGLAIDFEEGQLGEGYGRPTAAATEAAELLARTEGILTDPIYTAKALAGLIASVRSGAWDGERIVFWHAGGLPGIFEPLD